ncbi:MAG: hypothetical protein Q4C83_00975 [Candidatus Saccharibacteria bacterium]|nr:hypothetical protein [Candidatus Saccharibacteria bacterium]
MFNPKQEIYKKLSEIKDAAVSQSSQNIFNEVPAITYRIDGNGANYDLDNEIAYQDVRVSIDIFTDDSVTASKLLAQVEAKMREMKYRLDTSLDVPSPKGALYHINATFNGLR